MHLLSSMSSRSVALAQRARSLLDTLGATSSDEHTQKSALQELREVCGLAWSANSANSSVNSEEDADSEVGRAALLGARLPERRPGLLEVVFPRDGAEGGGGTFPYGLRKEALKLAADMIYRCCGRASAHSARAEAQRVYLAEDAESVKVSDNEGESGAVGEGGGVRGSCLHGEAKELLAVPSMRAVLTTRLS